MQRFKFFSKIISIFLIVTLAISLTGCKDKADTSSQTVNESVDVDSSVPESENLPDNPKDFAQLQKQNTDICAWIEIPGIEEINYPILQSNIDMDDNFYLDHDVDGNQYRAGSIYIQKLNSKTFDDYNTLIYGHNMSDGSMFGKLYDGSGKQFCNETFFNEHRTIYIYTPGHILEYEIISAFVYDDRHIINSFAFHIEEQRMDFFNTCLNPSSLTKRVLEGATLESDDRIITLSTCTSSPTERYLVIGKLINDTKTK